VQVLNSCRRSALDPARVRFTERLRLVPLGRQHAAELWNLHWYEEIAAWYAGRLTVQGAIDKAAEFERGWSVDGVHKWAAYDRESGDLVGRGGLSRVILEGQPCLEVGWIVRPDLWGRGFASEIARAALAFAFAELGADEVVAYTEVHNVRSRSVMERIGMHFERDFDLGGAPFVRYVIGRDAP
jgi:RimJ/RimL family protein N-acetyltransferase